MICHSRPAGRERSAVVSSDEDSSAIRADSTIRSLALQDFILFYLRLAKGQTAFNKANSIDT
jgi:hypothetical protein